MKNVFILILMAVCLIAEAQIQTPSASPSGSVTTTVGLTDVKITYSRPRAQGRKIFGDGNLVPFGKIWRTGANNGTRISFSEDVKVEGIAVPKGEYLILTWPGATEWTVSLYKDVELGGNTSGYKAENDAAKFTVKSEKLTEKVETFTINIGDIADNSSSAKVQLAWENTSVKFTVTVDFDAKVMASISEATENSANNYYQAASYYYNAKKDLNKALEWVTIAANSNTDAFWIWLLKARIQKELGDKKGALVSANASLAASEKAKNADYVKMNNDLIKTLK